MIPLILGLLNPNIGGFDPDAQAFIDAAVIIDSTQQEAINTLVIGLKADNLWNKMNAIYPIIGGTASQHKYNLKDPRDLDSAFRLTYAGTFTHSATGMQSVSPLSYADTHIIPNIDLLLNSTHFSIYSRTNSSTNNQDFGASSVGGLGIISAYLRFSDGKFYSRVYDAGYAVNNVANSLGLFTTSRTASNVTDTYRDGVFVANSSNVPVSGTYYSLQIANINIGGGGVSGPLREYSFTTVGEGLNITEQANLYTLVQAYQTTLGRQV